MYSTILIPTDGSEGADAAIKTGLTLAKQFDSIVHALSVIDERFVTVDYDMAVERAERRAEHILDQAGQRGTEFGIDVEKHLRTGVPHKEILRAIDTYEADLAIMGKYGRTKLDQFLHLGSVTDRVIRLASVPVLMVPVRLTDQNTASSEGGENG